MSELVVRAEAQGALPPEEVAAALGAPGGLLWIETPWELADDAVAAQGGELAWTLGEHSITAVVLRVDEQELHFRSVDGRLEGRIQLRPRADGGTGTAASFEGRFPASGGISDRVAVAVMRGNMEKLAGEETTKGLRRLLDNGVPRWPEKKAAARAPAPSPVVAALTVSPGVTQLDPVAVWRTALRRLPAVDSAPAKPPTASRLYPLDPSGRPLPAENETALALYSTENFTGVQRGGGSTVLWFLRADGGPAPAGDRRLYMGMGGGHGTLLVTERRLVGFSQGSIGATPMTCWSSGSNIHFSAPLEAVSEVSAEMEAKLFGGKAVSRTVVVSLDDGEQRGSLVLKLKQHLGGGPFAPNSKPDGQAALQHLAQAVARRQLELGTRPERRSELEAIAAGQLQTRSTELTARFAG